MNMSDVSENGDNFDVENYFAKVEEVERARFVEREDGSFGARVNVGGFGKWAVLFPGKKVKEYLSDFEIVKQGFSIVGEHNKLMD